MTLRAAFMGSPEFAVASLQAVAGACDLRVVVSQPDRPAGRGRKLVAPAVKEAAMALGVPVLQPLKVRDGVLAAQLRAHADLRETFAEERLEPRSREELADELAALRVALDEAREVLLDEALRAAYLAHLGD